MAAFVEMQLDFSDPMFNVPRSGKRFRGTVHSTTRLQTPNHAVVKVAETKEERAAAFELVHRLYYRTGLTPDSPMGMRVMKHHLLDTTDVMVSQRGDKVEFTVTLVRDGLHGMPADSLFADQIDPMRADGIRLAEVSCMASSCGDENKKQRFETLVKMMSLTSQAARRRGVDRLLLAVHPRHAKIYQRLFGCVPCSDVQEYVAVQGNPAVLCMHDFAQLDEQRYPLYDQIWGERCQPWQLDGVHMSAEEKQYFQQAVATGECEMVPMAV